MTEIRACDCCHREREIVGVASSSLGAISFGWCWECIDMRAEPEMMIQITLDMVDGNLDALVPEFRQQMTFKNGEYITAEQFRETWVPTPDPDEMPHDNV